jgi:hypothetical protein
MKYCWDTFTEKYKEVLLSAITESMRKTTDRFDGKMSELAEVIKW